MLTCQQVAIQATKASPKTFTESKGAFLFRSKIGVSDNALERINEAHHKLL